MISRSLLKARTLGRLGLANLGRVAAYRALVGSRSYERLLPMGAPITGPFLDFSACRGLPRHPAAVNPQSWIAAAQRVLSGELRAFSERWVRVGFPPDWRRSVLTDSRLDDVAHHWSRVPDFGLAGGDIKGFWEPSRFDGFVTLTLGWLCSGQKELGSAMETWLQDWSRSNPVNTGVQWKCGQESGIRLMQALLAVDLAEQWAGLRTTPSFAEWVAEHCARIAPTMLYAVGQDNNHGTSEAAALFAGGAWLVRQAIDPDLTARGHRWSALGRRWLENRLERLVMEDGSFSQHSTNYHRLMLDTCAFAETVRRRWDLPPWSEATAGRCAAATRWLAALTDPDSGRAPNLGANDGARLFVLDGSDYEDQRPSVRWAQALFATDAPLPAADDQRLAWLGLTPARSPSVPAQPSPCTLFEQGGYVRMAQGSAWLLLRLPTYRFRPSHADGLHLDFWLDGEERLCDGGSYAYNADADTLTYFSGTASHNTVQFDGRDQMPRLSRFLFGDWLRCETLQVDEGSSSVRAAYRDHWGARHERHVRLGPNRCTVTDIVDGFRERATLRWRLARSSQDVGGDPSSLADDRLRLVVRSSSPVARSERVAGWVSRHYGRRTPIVVLEVDVTRPSTLTTEISWNP